MSEKVDPKVLSLAKKLHRAGLAEVRRIEGRSDGSGWKNTSYRTKNGMIGIAKYVLRKQKQ